MAEKRKLLAEIEKCFKKIDEGVELFEETMGKMSESNSDNQREKLQDDLKKEIKKLQRLRDQVKNWQNSSEIKDKDKLTSYRKLIESKMEQFKDVERDHKTKPHSKQGLCAEEKLDPKERARHECVEWLNNTIRGLNDENDKLEANLEQLSQGENGRRRGKGKEDPKKVEKEKELKMLMEGVKFHIDKLELTMRLVENESLDPKDVEEALKDEMDQLFTQMDTDGTLYDCEGAYDELDLESFAAAFGKNPSLDDHDDSFPHNGHTSPDHTSRHPSTDVPPSPALVKRGNSISSNHHVPLKIMDPSPLLDGLSHAPLVSPSAPPTPPPPPVIPYNSIAAGAARTSANSTPASVGGKTVGTPSSSVASPSVGTSGPISPSIVSSPISTHPPPLVSTPSIPPPSTLPPPPPTPPIPIPSTPSTIVSTGGTTNDENGIPSSPEIASESGLEEEMVSGDGKEESSSSVVEERSPSPPLSPSSHPMPSSSTTIDNEQSLPSQEMKNTTIEDIRSLNDVSSLSEDLRTVLRMGQEPKSLEPQTAHIPAYLGASPLGRAPPMEDHDKHLSALEVALQRIPQPMDSEKPRSYLPKMPCVTPSFYPQQAPSNSDSMEYYLRLSPETLFFTFYYMEGSRAQLIAAKALKKLSWRFHTKYLMWFQRHEEPKQITDDFEEGTYIYFDYEKWSQRKKEQFRFEYRYLEDRELD